jgi:antitoxin PrlF
LIISKLTSKSQTTVPAAVRRALKLSDGDRLIYLIQGDKVILTKLQSAADDPFTVFDEWSGEDDTRAYAAF